MLSPMSEGRQRSTAVLEATMPASRHWVHPSTGYPPLRALPAQAEPVVFGSDARQPAETSANRASNRLGVIKVTVFARDAILRAGITDQLRTVPGLELVDERGVVADSVAVIVADELDGEVVGAIRAIRRCGCERIIAVASRFSRFDAEAAVRSGIRGLLRRADAKPDRLAELIANAANGGDMVATSSLALTEMLERPVEPEAGVPAGPPSFGLTNRDVEVLRLIAEGESTAAIARAMAYSESTIKNTIHTIVRQLGARNRAHAVATALRVQVI
jgi:DNA-binding NarL/FixJ family response regulator